MNRKTVVLCAVVLSTFLFSPSFLFAQTPSEPTCTCWCSTSEGAKAFGSRTKEECKRTCKSEVAKFLVCSDNPAQWPINDTRCFTQAVCTDPKEGYDGQWDTSSNPNCPSGYRYCFPKSGKEELELGVPIGNIKTVKDVETYLSAGFQWFIGVSVVITILLVMVGGLQYTLGAASRVQKEKGKKRIVGAVSGLMLLLLSVLLLQTVNPQLLKLETPQLPMIAQFGITPRGTSCEDYLEKKYTLSATKGQCGETSEIVKDPSGQEVKGSPCMWQGCPRGSQRCLLTAGGAKCGACQEVVEGRLGIGVNPSPSICNQFVYPKEKPIEGIPSEYSYCGWTKDSDLNPTGPASLQYGSCAFYSINCRQIKTCEDYDTNVIAQNNYSREPLEDIVSYESICGISGCGNFELETICEENPCAFEKGGFVKTRCLYDGRFDCESI